MKKTKQILAITGIVILVGMYVATLVLALVDSTAKMGMFKGSIALTIFVPVVIYGYTLVYKFFAGKNSSNVSDTKDTDSDNSQSK